MKRIITAVATVSVLGTAGFAMAAPYNNNNHYRGGGYSRTTTVRTNMRGNINVRPAATHVRSTFTRPATSFRNGYARTPVRPAAHFRNGYARTPFHTTVRVHTPIRTRFSYDWTRARARSASFYAYTSNMWARAHAYRGWNTYQFGVLSRLQSLTLAAQRFNTWGAYVDIATKQAELARIESEFAFLQAQGGFLAPYGSFSQLAASIGELRAQLNSYIAANATYSAPTASMSYPDPDAPPAYNY